MIIDHHERTSTFIRPKDNFTVQGVELLLQKKWYFVRDVADEQVLVLTEISDDAVQWVDKDFVESHCDVAKEVDGYKWIWDGLWRLEDNKYFEIVHMDSGYVLTINNIDDEEPDYVSETLHGALEMGVKLFKEWQRKDKRKSIMNRMTGLMEIANDLNNERYIEVLDFIYTDVTGREGGLTKNEIVLLNEISEKMAILS